METLFASGWYLLFNLNLAKIVVFFSARPFLVEHNNGFSFCQLTGTDDVEISWFQKTLT